MIKEKRKEEKEVEIARKYDLDPKRSFLSHLIEAYSFYENYY
jgi:hypothetical protein